MTYDDDTLRGYFDGRPYDAYGGLPYGCLVGYAAPSARYPQGIPGRLLFQAAFRPNGRLPFASMN